MEDTRLIQRLRIHSRAALEEAIRRYTSYVSVTVWRTLSAGGSAPREDVEEVVSDVFLSLWEHAGELHADKDLRPWLGAVARNNCAASCIGCKLCEKNCPQDAIHVIDNVAVIDYTKCTSCGVCVEKCPRKVLLDIHEDGKVAPVAKAGA